MTVDDIKEILIQAQLSVEEETFADGSTIKTYMYALTEQNQAKIFGVTEE